MKRNRLRWRLAVPLAVTFAALWLGMAVLMTNSVNDRMFAEERQKREELVAELEEQWDQYGRNMENGLGAESGNIFMENMSGAALALYETDGGAAVYARDADGNELFSQLAWGYGYDEDVDVGRRWFLTLDEGLDDDGQKAFARWILRNRKSWGYDIYPPDEALNEQEHTAYIADGRYARITGIELPGSRLSVQKIEIVHPDGAVEVAVETNTKGEDPITVELPFVRLSSALLPTRWSNGKDGYTNMDRRLANFRAAQAHVAEEEQVRWTGAGSSYAFSGRTGSASSHWPDGACWYVTYQTNSTPYAIRENVPLYVSTFVLMAVLLLILSKYLSKKITVPVERLCGAVEQGKPCERNGKIAELDTLAAAFNDAQQKLSDDLERQRELTRAVAHELKTPAAVLRAYAEGLHEDIAPEKREEYLKVLMEESDRMGALVGELLEFSRLEQGTLPLELEQVDLAELTERTFRRLELPMEQKGLRLDFDLAPVTLCADPARLGQVLDDLASNALRYADPGAVRVRLTSGGGLARLTVENNCAPIPEDVLAKLFQPFYRPDKARSRELGGSGLGLAIVANVVRLHGGACGAEPTEGGVRFWVELPVEN